jgi:predicted nucleic-acid-binding Zn-ribbon protein
MKNGKCLKCGGVQIRRLDVILNQNTSLGNSPEIHYRNKPLRTIGAVKKKTGVLSSKAFHFLTEAYACVECGYFEEYVKNPQEMPWDDLPESEPI